MIPTTTSLLKGSQSHDVKIPATFSSSQPIAVFDLAADSSAYFTPMIS